MWSTCLEIIIESVTAKQGAPSNIIISNLSSKIFIKLSNLNDCNNSDGFGGIFPDGIIHKFSTCV